MSSAIVPGIPDDYQNPIIKDIAGAIDKLTGDIRYPSDKHELILKPKGGSIYDSIVFNVQPQETINISNSSNIAIFNMQDSMPAIQILGPNKATISWRGIFYDKTNVDKYKMNEVNKMLSWQRTGTTVEILFGPIVKDMIIQTFNYEYKRPEYILYNVTGVIEEEYDTKEYLEKGKFELLDMLEKSSNPIFKAINGTIKVTGAMQKLSDTIYNKAKNFDTNVKKITNDYAEIGAAPAVNLARAVNEGKEVIKICEEFEINANKDASFQSYMREIGKAIE